MSVWDEVQVSRIGGATELALAAVTPGGGLSVRTTMWVVQVAGDVYVRSAHGPDGAWYQRALEAGAGHVWAGGVDAAVDLIHVDPAAEHLHGALDAAYRDKYHQYGPRIVGSVVGESAAEVTLRLMPAD